MGVPAISLILIICGIYVFTEIRGLPVNDRINSNSEEDRNHGVKHDLFGEAVKSSNDSGKESSGNSIEGFIRHYSITDQGKKSRVNSSTDKVWKNRKNISSNEIKHIDERRIKTDSSNNVENMTKQDCKEYLYEYRYLKESDMADNEAIRDALLMYQMFVGINASGECDVKTKAEIIRQRNGFPDTIEYHGSASRRRIKRYAIDSGLRWYKNTLTYWYENFTPDLSEADVKNQIEQALKLWADVTPLKFCEVSTETLADMRIRFAAGDHGDGLPFDGPGGRASHAFSPWNKGLEQNTMAGQVHFDEDEKWSTSDKGFNLLQIAVRSFGHALGLKHSNISGALMYPVYKYNPSFSLQSDDIAAIQALYGGPTGSKEDRIRFNLLQLIITGSALTNSVINVACTKINDFLLTTGLYDPVSCTVHTESSSDSGNVYSASLRISLDTSVSNAATLTTAVLNAAVPASAFISGVSTSTFATTSSTCSSQYKTVCDKGRANCIPLADGYACQCPPGMLNVGTIPDVMCASTRDGEISFAYMRDVKLVITGNVSSTTSVGVFIGHVCYDAVRPILKEYSIGHTGCHLETRSGSTYTLGLHMTSWIPLKTSNLNSFVTTAKLSTGTPLFRITNSRFSATAISCTTEQTAACYAQSGADCFPIAGGYYCQCPDGQIDVGYEGQLNCISRTSCLRTIGAAPPKTTNTPSRTPSRQTSGPITMTLSVPLEDGKESTPSQGLFTNIAIGIGAGMGGLLLGLITLGIVLCCKKQGQNEEAATNRDGSRDAAHRPALDITNPAFSPDVEPGNHTGREHNHQRNHNNPRGNPNIPGRNQSISHNQYSDCEGSYEEISNQPIGRKDQGIVRDSQARTYQNLHPGYEPLYENVKSNSANYISVIDSTCDQIRRY